MTMSLSEQKRCFHSSNIKWHPLPKALSIVLLKDKAKLLIKKVKKNSNDGLKLVLEEREEKE